MRRLLSIAGALLAGTAAQAGIDRVQGPIPETASSKIFGRSTVPGSPHSVDIASAGYVEQEYFVAGTADAFARHGDTVEVAEKAIPYVTRIIVRRPRDPRRFSGVVHLEPMHPQQGGQTNWFATAGYVMRSGDAYVAASLGDDETQRRKSATLPVPTAQSQVSKWFDARRYAALQWPEEDGIRFQIMADLGLMLRSKDRADNPLRGWAVRRVFMEGWSFTGSFQRTFIDEGFHDRARLPDGKPVFDGYLLGISSRWNGGGYLPLNRHERPAPEADPRRELKPIDAPVIEFMSEFEAATGDGPQRPDVDSGIGRHRLYQLGGVVHGESLNDHRASRTGRPTLVQLAAKGYPFDKTGTESAGQGQCPIPNSDLPHGALARAAMDNLKRWADDGIAPPRAAPLEKDGPKSLRRDATGNPVGGLRPAELDVPLARYDIYHGTDKPLCVAAKGRPIILRQELPKAELVRRYGSAAGYRAKYDAATDRLVAQHWLLPEDGTRLKAKAAAEAKADFEGAK
jgi:hypothetical protein